MTFNLKQTAPPPPRTPERQALADAIENKDAAAESFGANTRLLSEIDDRIDAATVTLNAARQAAGDAQVVAIRAIIDPSISAPGASAKELRDGVADAAERVETLRAARDAARQATQGLRDAEGWAGLALRTAAAAAVAGDPATRVLLDRYKANLAEAATLRRALRVIDNVHGIPDSDRFWGITEERGPDPSVAQSWETAIEELARDPDAALPTARPTLREVV